MKFFKRSILISLLLLLPFIITSCSSSQDMVTFTGDRPVRGEVSGTVVETFSDENPVEDARIKADDEIVSSGADGSYTLQGIDNNTEISVSKDGYESESRTIEFEEDGDEIDQNFRLNKKDEGDLQIELSWQQGAEDLDAHLSVPDRDNSDQEGYHIYYDDQGSPVEKNEEDEYEFTEYPYAGLDEDVRTYDKQDPESIEIEKLYEGRYIYFIKNFSMFDADDGEEIPEISESGATVRVREDGESTEYNAPENQTGMYWHLFEIEVDENGDYEIIEVNEITDDINGLDPEDN